MTIDNVQVFNADCLTEMQRLAAEGVRVDCVVTDPPYGISFMGKNWDHGIPGIPFWKAAYDLLPPGGHLLAFGGTRAFHRLACVIEDAGFEIRDTIMWVYGCLDEATEAVTRDGVKPYHKITKSDLVLCYDPANGGYSYQPVQEVVVYEYSDTAYRLIGDFGEQVVSRNHRCIVERDGKEVFVLAEEAAREFEVRVPVLEDLRELQDAISNTQPNAGDTQQTLRAGMHKHKDKRSEFRIETGGRTQGKNEIRVRSLREGGIPQHEMVVESVGASMQQAVQWSGSGRSLESSRSQGQSRLDARERSSFDYSIHRPEQPGMEGRSNLSKQEGRLFKPADQVRSLSGFPAFNGEEGWIRDGASADCSRSDWAPVASGGSGASQKPQGDGQRETESNAVCDERGSQIVRAWKGHKTALVRVVPFHYTGKVWCLRVPTGAFVAVRNGVAFPTGNSGFPKSHDVSKALDKAAGAERQVVGVSPHAANRTAPEGYDGWTGRDDRTITAPATEAAKHFEGWGTAMKPAWEPIIVARKPLEGTVAENVLAHGVGGINIDGCRVAGSKTPAPVGNYTGSTIGPTGHNGARNSNADHLGRWPANVVWSKDEDQYILRSDLTNSEKTEVYRWLSENP